MMSETSSYTRCRPHALRLVVTGLLCSLAGCGGGTPTDETGRDVAEWVIAQGGSVVVAGSDFKRSRRDQLPDGPLGIREIDLAGRGIVDSDLTKLEGLSHLRKLTLHQAKVSDQGMATLAELGTLTDLELSYTLVTDEGIEQLAPLHRLEKLYVRGTAVTEEGANALAGKISGLKIER